ncbi:MAG: MBL fold metallo-hydrolase [Candidatus Eremiobacteraeota bacterium]|nr:MBL fold metallo-hydrolase [Candidatus Eremiobacteraeota bacterium]
MDTRTDEIAPKIYRFSTYVPDADLVFNQYLIDAAEPLLFHTGMRQLFPVIREAMSRVISVERLRWITFGHYEADECGSMNEWLMAAPQSSVAHGAMGSRVSIMDQAIRAPRLLSNNEVLDIGGYRVRRIETPHVPHGWDAGLMYEETTQTLFAGDLFTQFGHGASSTEGDIVGPALMLEEALHPTALTPGTAPTIRSLAQLPSERMALMHGPVFDASPREALESLADYYGRQLSKLL